MYEHGMSDCSSLGVRSLVMILCSFFVDLWVYIATAHGRLLDRLLVRENPCNLDKSLTLINALFTELLKPLQFY